MPILLLALAVSVLAETVPDAGWFGHDEVWRVISAAPAKRLAVIADAPEAREHARKAAERPGTAAWLVAAEPSLSRPDFRARVRKSPPPVPLLWDAGLLAVEELGLKRSGEAVLVELPSRTVLYRGDSSGLAAALDGRPSSAPARGAPLPLPGPPADYAAAGPILAQRCAACHLKLERKWLSSHAQAAAWAPIMRETVLNGRMPPRQAVDPNGLFQTEVSLSTSERRALLSWFSSGAPRGSGPDALESVAAPAAWPLGEPDLILRPAWPQAVGPDKELPEVMQALGPPPDEDVWVRGIYVRPGNPRVLHHANVVDEDGRLLSGRGQDRFFPEGTGILLPAGARLSLQAHYRPSGREESDLTEVGLYLAKGPLRPVTFTVVADTSYVLEPGARDVPARAQWTLPEDAQIAFVSLHMHFRGSRIALKARPPGEPEKLLLLVPMWTVWNQPFYAPRGVLRYPKGTVFTVEGAFDNSAGNPFNPDPAKRVVDGGMSDDNEMFQARIGWAPAK